MVRFILFCNTIKIIFRFSFLLIQLLPKRKLFFSEKKSSLERNYRYWCDMSRIEVEYQFEKKKEVSIWSTHEYRSETNVARWQMSSGAGKTSERWLLSCESKYWDIDSRYCISPCPCRVLLRSTYDRDIKREKKRCRRILRMRKRKEKSPKCRNKQRGKLTSRRTKIQS